jgi:nucleoside-diphosphate-sugar epimerase
MSMSDRTRHPTDRTAGSDRRARTGDALPRGVSVDRRRTRAGLPPGVTQGRRRTDRIIARLSPIGVLSRVIGDAGISFLSVMAALVVASVRDRGDTGLMGSLGTMLVPNGLILAAVFVAAVTVSNTVFGVYARQRTYPMRTKMLRLTQSALVAGSAAGVLFLLLPPELAVSRFAFVGAWVLTALLLPASRWWSWAYRMDVEARQARSDAQAGSVQYARRADDPGKVLVVGGAGYIGSALLPKLLESGHQVRVLDVFMYGKKPIEPFLDHPNLEVVEADYRQIDQLVQAMQGVKSVVHLGGLVGDPACAWNESLTIEVNLTFTRVIAEVAKASGVRRFVFASTCSVYGASDEVLDEDSELHPVSLYARSKIGSEKVLRKLHGPGFAVTNLRFGTIYGISGRTRFDLVVNLLTAKAYVDKGITVFGGDQWRPFVHVSDAAKAVSLVVDAPVELVAGRTFNVGSDEGNATLGDVGRLINRIVPEAEYVDSGRDGDRRNYRVSFRRIREELGFVPDWNLEGGVRQVLAALRSGDITDYRAPEYSNVAFLTGMNEASTYLTTESEYARVLITESGDRQVLAPEPIVAPAARAAETPPAPSKPPVKEATLRSRTPTHPEIAI